MLGLLLQLLLRITILTISMKTTTTTTLRQYTIEWNLLEGLFRHVFHLLGLQPQQCSVIVYPPIHPSIHPFIHPLHPSIQPANHPSIYPSFSSITLSLHSIISTHHSIPPSLFLHLLNLPFHHLFFFSPIKLFISPSSNHQSTLFQLLLCYTTQLPATNRNNIHSPITNFTPFNNHHYQLHLIPNQPTTIINHPTLSIINLYHQITQPLNHPFTQPPNYSTIQPPNYSTIQSPPYSR